MKDKNKILNLGFYLLSALLFLSSLFLTVLELATFKSVGGLITMATFTGLFSLFLLVGSLMYLVLSILNKDEKCSLKTFILVGLMIFVSLMFNIIARTRCADGVSLANTMGNIENIFPF